MTKDPSILTVERRRIILEQLYQNKQVSIFQLKKQFRVSEVTLRKDLHYLENKKLLIRSRGGAMLPVKIGNDLSVDKRKVLNLSKKKSIAFAASSLFKAGDTIIMDSGTTLMELAKLLKGKENMTIITNALDIALKISEVDDLKIIIPGGIFRKKSYSLVGVNAVQNLQIYRADKYFLSADGITADGVFTSNLEEGQIAKIVMSHAKENIILVDSSKFGRMGIINFAPLNKIHTLITDKKIPKEYNDMLVKLGIKVVIV
jgi:DeoR family transcriptional regulator of aga operon